MHKIWKYGSLRDVLNGLDSSKFSEILYSNTTPDKFSIYLVKITFKHLSFVRNAYLNGHKRQNPSGIEVLNFLFFRFILDYKYQNNLSYIEALRKTESEFRFVYFFYTPCISS